MTYDAVHISTSTDLNLPLMLNQITDGWVPQILNGTFGSNREYNFTGNVVTSMSEKQIDINMRLTPAVPIPAKPARYFLDFLSHPKINEVSLINTDEVTPNISYVRNETTTYTKPTINTIGYTRLTQKCVIRELKYNYSEYPATIEFTISTKMPILYGKTFNIYMGLGNQNWSQAIADVKRVIGEVSPMTGEVDFRTLDLSLPAIGTSKYSIFDRNLDAFKAVLQGNSTSNPGRFLMYSFIDGTKRFSIEGGYARNASACYAVEAYPTFRLGELIPWLSSLRTPPKIDLDGTGKGYARLEFTMARKGI